MIHLQTSTIVLGRRSADPEIHSHRQRQRTSEALLIDVKSYVGTVAMRAAISFARSFPNLGTSLGRQLQQERRSHHHIRGSLTLAEASENRPEQIAAFLCLSICLM
jgi:hypothetical protein